MEARLHSRKEWKALATPMVDSQTDKLFTLCLIPFHCQESPREVTGHVFLEGDAETQHELLMTQQALNRVLLSKSHHGGAHRCMVAQGKERTHICEHMRPRSSQPPSVFHSGHMQKQPCPKSHHERHNLDWSLGLSAYVPVLNHTPYFK